MAFRLAAALRGDLAGSMKLEEKAGAHAVTVVINRRTQKLKLDVRGLITGAGLGGRLANAVRGAVFPGRGESLSAKGRVFSKAIIKRPGGSVDLVTVFEEGATIRARGGKFLAIPVGVGKAEKLSSFDRKDIAIVPFRRGRGYVVLRRGARRAFGAGGGGVLFILVPETHIRSRYSLAAAADTATVGIEDEIANEWDRAAG